MAAVAVALVAAGCLAPGRASVAKGPYVLELSLPRTVWSASEVIEGEASLSHVEGDARDLSGSSSNPILFGFAELGGTRLLEPFRTLDCAPVVLEAGMPIRLRLVKSGGGWSGDDPNAAFYEEFFADPLLRLPPGEWRVTAFSSFIDGRNCDGETYEMETWIDIRVVP